MVLNILLHGKPSNFILFLKIFLKGLNPLNPLDLNPLTQAFHAILSYHLCDDPVCQRQGFDILLNLVLGLYLLVVGPEALCQQCSK